MSEGLEVRRKRLAFRAWHRGTKETDLILGRFADRHLGDFDADQLDQFEALLERPDPELFDWVAGLAEPPPEMRGGMVKLLMGFKISS